METTRPEPSTDVLVAGGGIGGLATALAVGGPARFRVRVAEAAPEIRPLGVGINLLPHAVTALDRLGMLAEVERIGLRVDQMAYYNQFGSLICTVPRGPEAGYQLPQYSVHRGEFQIALLRAVEERLGKGVVVTGRTVTGFVQDADGVDVDFEGPDGPGTQRARVLVGADGIHSRVRALLHGSGQIKWNERVMWRGVSRIDAPFLQARTVLFAGHPDQRFIAYPILAPSGDTVLNWIAAYRIGGDQPAPEDWNRRADQAKIVKLYAGWKAGGLDIEEAVASADAVLEYPMSDRDPLEGWTTGRVTLVGDSAHPMYPTGSQGSSQAIIDAVALGEELAVASDETEGLVRYEGRRREATTRIVLSNRKMADARVLELVYERAPMGFKRVDDVISQEEIDEITSTYAKTAGFDHESLSNLARGAK